MLRVVRLREEKTILIKSSCVLEKTYSVGSETSPKIVLSFLQYLNFTFRGLFLKF